MTIDELQRLAISGVKIEITANDLRSLLYEIAHELKQQNKATESDFITIDDAIACYKKSRPTIIKDIKNNVLMGKKVGGRWYVESPSHRMARI